ncbi:winged helix-turn-helix transcriptional regulator [Plantactinospora sp. S1510]|uniref:Winged helix-turn-helix transcriptional regulator n=1 Tax=Plantactinospora alkalitolerans TaxID=2789879 RepID=A0ABS0GY13_9ACTN|nr:winged helix-turn-helix transcriptional regulator [Plantactinospora alkalitolerans]MBF9131106.1 winged helix-turn-helix transcriptional regulator [Plantactinospora alkalitolerans]
MKKVDLADADCGIAQSLGVLTDWWTFLLIRDIAGGVTRFDGLQRGLGMSRRALTERLAALTEHGVLHRRRYTDRPPRHDYLLTAKGEGLLPVLIALQEWGDRHVLGDGSLTATAAAGSAEARRMHALVGRRLPELTLVHHDGTPVPPAAPDAWTVLYCFPGAFVPGVQGYPPSWGDIPGAHGCTLESNTYAARAADFTAAGALIHGVSTQRPDQLAAFAAHAELPFPLLSDADGRLAASLLLPTFRAAGTDRLKRATLLLDPAATVRAVQFPVTDPAGSVSEMLRLVQDHVPEKDGARG